MTTPNTHTKKYFNQLTREHNREAFIREFGREPHDYEEVKKWADGYTKKILERYPMTEKELAELRLANRGKLMPFAEFI